MGKNDFLTHVHIHGEEGIIPPVTMIPTLIISIATFLLITLSLFFFPSFSIKGFRIDCYWIIALLGAILLLSFSFAPIGEVFSQLTSDESINPLKVLILFFSMTLLSIFLDECGLFRVLAAKAARKSSSSQLGLFLRFYVLTGLLTIFTSNDIVILTLTPFLCLFCKHAKINPLPYLIAEFMAANTYSMALVIGNPTNIYLASSAGIDFFRYFFVMGLPTLAAGAVEVSLLLLLFWKKLKEPLAPFEENAHIESKVDLILGVAHLAVCLVFLALSNLFHLDMWLISLIAAVSLLLFALGERLITRKNWNYLGDTFKRLPYPLIPFFLSMFVIVVAFSSQGITAMLGKALGENATIYVYGYSSLAAANLINNIPMSILFASLPEALTEAARIQAIYATIIGSNIGAFLTPLGALAGIMFSGLLSKYEVKYSFFDFAKYGFLVGIPAVTAALATLSLTINFA